MNHFFNSDNTLPSNYSQPLRYPDVANKRGNGLLRLVANVAAPLSGIPRPGNEIVYQWRTQAELNQEQKEFEKMQTSLKIEPGREF